MKKNTASAKNTSKSNTPAPVTPEAPTTTGPVLTTELIAALRTAGSIDEGVKLLQPDTKTRAKADATYALNAACTEPLPQKRGACLKVITAIVRLNRPFKVADVTAALPQRQGGKLLDSQAGENGTPGRGHGVMGHIYKRGKVWWIGYYRNGRQYLEGTGSESHEEAKRQLKLKEGDIERGVPVSPKMGQLRFEEARDDLLNDVRNNGRPVKKLEARIANHPLNFHCSGPQLTAKFRTAITSSILALASRSSRLSLRSTRCAGSRP